MRAITQITIALFLLGWLATAIDLPRDKPTHQHRTLIAWRRTSTGWEQTGAWASNSSAHQQRLNPLFVALEEILICTFALVALRPERMKNSRYEAPAS